MKITRFLVLIALALATLTACASTMSFRAPGMQDQETEVARAQAETAKALVEALKAIAVIQRVPPAAFATPAPAATPSPTTCLDRDGVTVIPCPIPEGSR